jgi:protein involved in polysaccharide export with SLBB domain
MNNLQLTTFHMLLTRRILLLCLIFFVFLSQTFSQLPADMRNIKASQISDQQLQQIAQQVQSSGMTDNDLMQQLQQRGLPESEIQTLISRVKAISGGMDNATEAGTATTGIKRSFKGEMTIFKAPEVKSRVFGAELFTGANPMFVPNLKIATPKSYIIGPEDELQLDVYGNNISNQKLVVSPDGLINVKYAGPVNVSGMTIEQASNVLKARLLKYYPALSNGATKLQLTLGSVRSIQVSVIGAVKKPGTVTMPSIATLFNALYASGGPLDNGSFRNIELIRNNNVLVVADLYEFIVKGDQRANLSLQDNDVIRVPYAQTQIILDGGLNRTGIFEMKNNESVAQALDYAGGFKGNAFRGAVSGTRFTDRQQSIIDVSKEKFSSFYLQHGDSLYVDSVVSKFDNRVYITGAVYKPGAYSLEKDMDLKRLIEKAQGLKEDAFANRANMVRKSEDLKKSFFLLNLNAILKGNERIMLKKEDSIHIASALELRDTATVRLLGPVKRPGDFRYEDSMSLGALILQSGGFLENATPTRIEIGRRKADVQLDLKGEPTSEIINIDISMGLDNAGSNVVLMPYDIVSIKVDPFKVKQVAVKISGEIKYVGSYTLANPEERLSSLINRAGGLLPYADINGAKLIRKKEKVDTSSIKRLAKSSVKLEALNMKSKEVTASLVNNDELESQTTEVALDLKSILENPGSNEDIILKDEDELVVPRFVNTVSIGGEVLQPVTVQFQNSRGFGAYISAAGGYSRNAYKSRAFITYANGRAARTKSFFGIRVHPKVKPGSSIFVPLEPATKGFDPSKFGVLISALTSLSTIFVLLFR